MLRFNDLKRSFIPGFLCLFQLLFFGCQGLVSNTVNEMSPSALEDQAYQEVMALNSPEALKKIMVHGGDSAVVTNIVNCDISSSTGDSTSYNFELIGAQLNLAPALGKILGFQEISECEDARRFIEKKYTLIEGRSSPEMEETEEFSTQESVLMKSSIREGIDENSLGKVRLIFANGGSCTGSIIGPRVILTAAHCIDGSLVFNGVPVRSGRNSVSVRYFSPSVPSPQFITVASGQMHLIVHPTYAGDGDAQSDVGLIITDAPLPTTDYLRFYVGTMANGRRNRAYGAGYNAHAGTGLGVMRRGSEYVDWYGSHHYYATESGSMQICGGDSGGPWVRDDNTLDAITGITSNVDVAFTGHKNCVRGGGRMRQARMSTKVSWIDAQLRAYGAGSCTTIGDFAKCY